MKQKRDVDPVHWDVMVRDRAVCQYCGLDGKIDVRILCSLQLDHLRPKRCGQPWDVQEHRDNKVVCCPYCNTCKSGWDPADGIELGPDAEANRMLLVARAREYVLGRMGLLTTLPVNYYNDLFGYLQGNQDKQLEE